jgi:hypothetical protein
MTPNRSGLELRSKISSDGTLELFLEEVAVPEPAPDELVIRIEAASSLPTAADQPERNISSSRTKGASEQLVSCSINNMAFARPWPTCVNLRKQP